MSDTVIRNICGRANVSPVQGHLQGARTGRQSAQPLRGPRSGRIPKVILAGQTDMGNLLHSLIAGQWPVRTAPWAVPFSAAMKMTSLLSIIPDRPGE